jgi:hypothetical protein
MAIVKWKGKVYSITVAWPLMLFGFAVSVGLAIVILGTAREFLGR